MKRLLPLVAILAVAAIGACSPEPLSADGARYEVVHCHGNYSMHYRALSVDNTRYPIKVELLDRTTIFLAGDITVTKLP